MNYKKELFGAEFQYRVCFRLSLFDKNLYLVNDGKVGQYRKTMLHKLATVFRTDELVKDALEWIEKNHPSAEIFVEESRVSVFKIIKTEEQDNLR